MRMNKIHPGKALQLLVNAKELNDTFNKPPTLGEMYFSPDV